MGNVWSNSDAILDIIDESDGDAEAVIELNSVGRKM